MTGVLTTCQINLEHTKLISLLTHYQLKKKIKSDAVLTGATYKSLQVNFA